MKVWKSPVFYFGILLVMVIAGLLSAPYVIDWNSYRADLEAYGKKLTGRPVKIEGPVSVQLFPWPKLAAENVSLANPPGLDAAEFAHADRIVVRMTLAGLARGGIDVQSVDIEGPSVHFERLATGEGNWQFQPAADLIKSDVLSRVSLDQIRLQDGTVTFSDRRRGETFRLDDVNASVTSPGITGPWRLRALALHDDRSVDISLSTGIWTASDPFRFGLRVAAADGSGLVFSFDGTTDGSQAQGELRIEPATTDDGKGDAEGKVRPLVMTSKVDATFDQINMQALEIAPQDPKQGGAVTTGSASFKLGQHIDAKADLKSAMLDLDELAGAKSRTLLREAGSLALADSLLRLLPSDMSLAGSVSVSALKTGGETLENVRLAVEADSNALRIKEFSTGLPGRSQMLFKGIYFPGAQGAEIAGELAVEASDLRQLVQWLWPEARASIASLWTGSRGRFKLQTDLSITAARLHFSKAQYELDGEQGTAALSVTPAGRGAVDLRIDGNRIDIDNYMPQGVSALSAAASQGAGGLAAMLLPRADAPDLRLTVQTAGLVLNGVTASDVVVDLASGANGLDLRALEIGSVGGAKLQATGLILDNGKGADGSIGLQVNADDPRELLRLLGLIHGDSYPAWASSLGPAAVKGTFGVKPDDMGSAVSFGLEGTAGAMRFNGSGSIGPQLDIAGEMVITSLTSGPMAGLLGLVPMADDDLPARVSFKAAGTAKDGFMADAAMQVFGARLDYRGSVNPFSPGYGVDGTLALRSTDVTQLLAASGMPHQLGPGAVLVVDSGIASSATGWKLPNVTGRLNEAKFNASLEVTPELRVNGQVETGALSLPDVLAPVFLSWTGAGPDLETAFAARLPFGLTGEFWLRPNTLQVHQHFAASDAEVGIVATPDEINLALFGKDQLGRGVKIGLTSRGTDSSRKLSGRLTIPVDLSTQLLLTNGSPVASGVGAIDISFEGEGRSTGGALAGLRGSGAYGFEDFRVIGLSPQAFGQALAEAKDATGITKAFDALRGGEGLAFGKISGSITMANGEVGFLPFGIKTPDADVMVKTVAELALGQIDAEISVQLKARADLPAMSVSYVGPPAALARSEDNSEISTKLGVAIMQKGIDELERLQQEQKRLAEQEEKQRIEDEARLAAYYAQRDELLLRKRELKVHSEMRVVEAERLRQLLEEERAANAEINKSEMKQRLREIRVFKRLARLTSAVTPPAKPAAAKPRPEPQLRGPVVLAKPEGAPLVISPPPGDSPSQ